MRKLIYAVVGLAVLLIAAVVIAVLVVDLNQYKGEIEAEVESATGRDVTLGGDIHVTFWPSIGAAIDDVEIANAAGGSSEPMVRAETLQVVVAIAPLLSGNVQVESIRIVKPTILVETLADGSSNLELEPEQGTGGTGTASSGGGPSTPVRIDRIEVVDGTVIYRDLAAGSEERVEGINMSAQARTLQGPFQADGSLTYKGMATTFAVDIGNMNRPSLPVSLRLGLNGDAARVTFNGQLSGLDVAPMVGGNLLVQADSLDAVLSPFTAGLGGGAKALTDQAFELDAQVVADAASVNLADLALSLGDIRATGDVTVATEDGTRIDVALAANHLDADMLIEALAEAEGGASEGGGSGTVSTDETESAEAPSDGGAPAEDSVPHDLVVAADLSVDAITYNDNVIRQLHLIATLDDGILAVEQLRAGLPGGTSLAVAGRVENYLSEPNFRGQVELASDNARTVLDWLQVDLPDVPPERLRRVDLFASVSAEPGVL